jgi:hypothetical protein
VHGVRTLAEVLARTIGPRRGAGASPTSRRASAPPADHPFDDEALADVR